jgi:hypothetical protein
VAAVLAGGGTLLVKKLARRPREVAVQSAAPPPAPRPTVAPPAISPATGAAAVDPKAAAIAAPKRSPVLRRVARPSPPPAPAPPAAVEPVATRTFTLGPTPQNVDVYLDGQRQFGYDVDHTKISVPWAGVHYIEFRSPSNCCFPERVSVGPDQPLPADSIIARRLKWRPAHLVVTTEPASTSTRILVRDPARGGATTAARPGEEIDIPFSADEDSSKEVEISAEDGDGLTTEHVRVRAGQRIRHVVKLKAGAN